MSPFAPALPLPSHHLPGGLLATSIRDALTLSSFRAHMGATPESSGVLEGTPDEAGGDGSKTGCMSKRAPDEKKAKLLLIPKRTRKRKARPRRSIALDAMRAIRINELSRRAVQQVNGRRVKLTPEEVAEGARLLAEVMGPVLKMTKRRGWVHVPEAD